MLVVLNQHVANLGHPWDVVNVKNGYARNFLFPRQLATPASEKLMEVARKRKEERTRKMDEIVANAKEMAQKMEGLSIVLSMKAKAGKLYGSIGEKEVVEGLKTQHKMELSKEMVIMPSHLKALGSHSVSLRLTPEVSAKIIVKVEEEK